MVEVYEDVVGWDASEGKSKSNPCVNWIGVQGEEDHKETRKAEHNRDEERDLQTRYLISECNINNIQLFVGETHK